MKMTIVRIPETFPWVTTPLGATREDLIALIDATEAWPFGYSVFVAGAWLDGEEERPEFLVLFYVPWLRSDQVLFAYVRGGQKFGLIPTEAMVGDRHDVRLVVLDGEHLPWEQFSLPPGYTWGSSIDQDNDDN
jgi:hypothetical protein